MHRSPICVEVMETAIEYVAVCLKQVPHDKVSVNYVL